MREAVLAAGMMALIGAGEYRSSGRDGAIEYVPPSRPRSNRQALLLAKALRRAEKDSPQ